MTVSIPHHLEKEKNEQKSEQGGMASQDEEKTEENKDDSSQGDLTNIRGLRSYCEAFPSAIESSSSLPLTICIAISYHSQLYRYKMMEEYSQENLKNFVTEFLAGNYRPFVTSEAVEKRYDGTIEVK